MTGDTEQQAAKLRNLLTEHPSEEVRTATLRLLDALCSWERSTGRGNLVIIKDSIGVQYRSWSGHPVPEDTGDHTLLENWVATEARR